MKVVAEVEVGPAVGVADGVVERHMQLAQTGDVVGVLVRIVDTVVRLRKAFLAIEHQRGAVLVELPAKGGYRVGQ